MIINYEKQLPGLEDGIIDKINKIKKRRLFIKQSAFELISLLSLFGVVLSVIYNINYVSSSGIYSYISLIFSDIQVIVYWKELLLSILESIPSLGLAVSFAVMSVFLWSILRMYKVHEMRIRLI